MRRNVIETVLGGVVIAVAGVFLVFAYTSANLRSVEGYEVTANFSSVGGLQVGGDVRVSGVRVGSIVSQTLDPKTFLAVVRMSIDPAIRLPKDTVAVVASESLLGGKYLALEPGGDPDLIEPGGRIEFTQSTPGLEQLLGQVIFSLQGGGGQKGGNAPETEGAAPGGAAPGGGGLLGQ